MLGSCIKCNFASHVGVGKIRRHYCTRLLVVRLPRPLGTRQVRFLRSTNSAPAHLHETSGEGDMPNVATKPHLLWTFDRSCQIIWAYESVTLQMHTSIRTEGRRKGWQSKPGSNISQPNNLTRVEPQQWLYGGEQVTRKGKILTWHGQRRRLLLICFSHGLAWT